VRIERQMDHSIQHVSAATRSRSACLPSAAASENYIWGSKVVFCPNGIRCLTLRTASVEQARKSVASLFDGVKSGVFNSAPNCKSTRNDSSIAGYYNPMEYIPVNLSRLHHDDTEGHCSYRCTHFYISPVSRQPSYPGCITHGTSCIGGWADPIFCLDIQRHKNIPCRCRYSKPEHPARNLVITAAYSTWIKRLRPEAVHFNFSRGKG